MTELLENLNPALLEEQARVTVNHVVSNMTSAALRQTGASRTPGVSKNIEGFYTLVKEAIDHVENVGDVSDEMKVDFTRDYSLKGMKNEIITYSLKKRQPGDFSQNEPFGGGAVKNYRPIFREELEDEDNPGYKKLTFGYWYDNMVEFKCYGRTNKEADDRALWFENFMTNYLWFFRYSGVQRVLYLGRGEETSVEADGYTMFGRSIKFFVRTEEISVVSEKAIEQVVVNFSLINQ